MAALISNFFLICVLFWQEERAVAVSMYAKSRLVEQEILHLKLKEMNSPGETS